MTAVLLVAGLLLPDFGHSAAWSVGQSMLVFFLGALAGAWIARGGFVLPALLVWALFWGVIAWLLHRIGAPAGGPAVGEILQYNLWAIAGSGLATLAGALAGQVLARGTPRTT